MGNQLAGLLRGPGLRLAELHGPGHGVVVLPVHLTWHGYREFDVSERDRRLLLYSIVISKGRRNDLARFVNPARLREDWPELKGLLGPRGRRLCERLLAVNASGG